MSIICQVVVFSRSKACKKNDDNNYVLELGAAIKVGRQSCENICMMYGSNTNMIWEIAKRNVFIKIKNPKSNNNTSPTNENTGKEEFLFAICIFPPSVQ